MFRVICISLLLLPLIAAEALADVVVIVRREAEAGGNYVRVCDIARVEGPKDQAAEVGRTVLGPTPGTGQTMEISRWDIESRLYEMGFAASVTFTGNESVKVFGNGASRRSGGQESAALQGLNPIFDAHTLRFDQGGGDGSVWDASQARLSSDPSGANAGGRNQPGARPASSLDGMSEDARDRVAKAVSRYLTGRYNRPDIEVESRLNSISGAIGDDVFEVTVEGAEGSLPGKVNLRLRVKDAAEAQPRQVMAAAEASVFAMAPVAVRKMSRGEVLGRKDVAIKRVRMESGKSYFKPSPEVVEGRELKSNVEAGAPILATETAVTEAVKRGATVVTENSGTGWKVQGRALALEGGMVGDLIKVQDSNSKQKIPARVTGRNQVEVLVNQAL